MHLLLVPDAHKNKTLKPVCKCHGCAASQCITDHAQWSPDNKLLYPRCVLALQIISMDVCVCVCVCVCQFWHSGLIVSCPTKILTQQFPPVFGKWDWIESTWNQLKITMFLEDNRDVALDLCCQTAISLWCIGQSKAGSSWRNPHVLELKLCT